MPNTAPISVGPHGCGNLVESADQPEWLVADGVGGYATGTVSGLRTRRCHGLLVVADPNTAVRRLALAALDLTLSCPSGATVALFSHGWASGALSPDGHRFLEQFSLQDGLPRWRWRVGNIVVERELAMLHGQASLAVVHRVVAAPGPVGLSIAAMCTWRDAHTLRHASGPGLPVEQVADGVVVADAYRLSGPGWQPAGVWHLGAYARQDADHGDGAAEDLWLAGAFTAQVAPGAAVEISAWAGSPQHRPPPATAVVRAARERAHRIVAAAKPIDDHAGTVALAADAFVIDAPDGPDVVAGYPWLGSLPGDTMTSYEGLLLATGRADEGRELLIARTRSAIEALHAGPDAATTWTARGSVDAPLWLVHAVDRHVVRTGDSDLAATLIGPLGRLLRAHLSGRGTLRVEHDELVRLTPARPADPAATESGAAELGATDPAAAGTAELGAVEPGAAGRIGKPVELNALWVNALAAMADLLDEAGRDGERLRRRYRVARDSFAARFRAPDGWLFDVVDGPPSTYPLGAGAYHNDPSLRANQLLAWSLPHAPLAGTGAADAATLRTLGGALLTPLGLRSLAPDEYGYRGTPPDRAAAHRQGIRRGGPHEAAAADQGTVWPWLIGPYVDGCRQTGVPTDDLLTGLAGHVYEYGLGSVSESADGDAPHRATGCPFSARSVAEVLRVRAE